jgi:hypothetical protein
LRLRQCCGSPRPCAHARGPHPLLPIEAWVLLDGGGELREEVEAEDRVEGWVSGHVGPCAQRKEWVSSSWHSIFASLHRCGPEWVPPLDNRLEEYESTTMSIGDPF